MKIKEIKVNHQIEPLGYATCPLSLSWKVEGLDPEEEISSTRVKIYEDRVDCLAYDSKFLQDINPLDFKVTLKTHPRTRYRVEIESQTDTGKSDSSISYFETGKGREKWQGKWISPQSPNDQPPRVFKKFWLDKKTSQARLYICGLGVYEVYINGQKLGHEFLAPGYHSYDCHLQTQTYDATEVLEVGENRIEVFLGDGWFKGRLGFDGGYTNLYGNHYYVIGELWIEDTQGDIQVIGTDQTFLSEPSPIVFSNIYDGEIYDMRPMDQVSAKKMVEKVPDNCGQLMDRYSLPVVKKEKLEAKALIKTPKDEWVVDFGQNITGWVEADILLEEGKMLRMTASEILQDGCFYHENMRTAKTEFIYYSDGKKRKVRPHFTFFGFRYMKIEMEGQVHKEDFTAYHLRSDFDEIGVIKTGHKGLNQLFSNALWSQKDNSLDVPTDCPQRDERLGWTGDAGMFSETACYNMDMLNFYRKYLWDMRAEQELIGGAVPNVVPRLKEGMVSEYGSSPWSDAGVIIPWNIYRHYGSKTLLEETYPGMKAWVDYRYKKACETSNPYLVTEGFHFGDWLALDNETPGPFGKTDSLYIASAYYYRCAEIVAQASEILGKEDETRQYRSLAQKIKGAIKSKYFDEQGLCLEQTQTGIALAIVFGLTSSREKEGIALRGLVETKKNHLDTGFVGTTLLCPALTISGQHETAVSILLQEDYPGWLYAINLGATTIWERWNSVLENGQMNPEGMNSLNHYSYGSIEAWMYRYVCGYEPKEAGFLSMEFKPHPDERLGNVKSSLRTSLGTYEMGWTYVDGKIIYECSVPSGAKKACLRLPKGKYKVLESPIPIKEDEEGRYLLKAGLYKVQEV